MKNIERVAELDRNDNDDPNDNDDNDIDDEETGDIGNFETTTEEEMKDFNSYVKATARNQIQKHNEGRVRMNDDTYLQNISSLNTEQRKMFDDFVERIKDQEDNKPFYLYIGGEAGTGKSFLLKLMIEAVNRLPHYSGQALDKPFSITIAPTGIIT